MHILISLASLFAVCLATSIVPGPNNFMLMRFGMRHGRCIALAAGFGAAAACLAWSLLAAAGLAVLLTAAPWLDKALRIVGGFYLVWFAIALWRAAPGNPDGTELAATPRWPLAFWQGFSVNMINPKTVLFFASIFSAYVGSRVPDWAHAAAVAVCVSTCLAWQIIMAFLFSTRQATEAYAQAQRPLDRAAGALMGAFGIRLLWVFN